MLGLPTETEEDMRAIPELADQIARRYYEIPKDQRNGKLSDHNEYIILHSKAVHTIPVGKNVYE